MKYCKECLTTNLRPNSSFNENGVSPYVYGMALMEIGIAALAKVGEDEATIVEQAQQITSRVLPIVSQSS